MYVAIVDYGMGNLFSVKHACEYAGLPAMITSSSSEILSASAVILPGVGAFGEAITTLSALDLVSPLRDFALSSGKPFWGICLGFQLMMQSSSEFGDHEGLGLISGTVEKLGGAASAQAGPKVPQVGWNSIHHDTGPTHSSVPSLGFTPLTRIPNGTYMYFVHSYYVSPTDHRLCLTTTNYGGNVFCSSLQSTNIFGCQFHPERSGRMGLRIYQNLASHLLPNHGEV